MVHAKADKTCTPQLKHPGKSPADAFKRRSFPFSLNEIHSRRVGFAALEACFMHTCTAGAAGAAAAGARAPAGPKPGHAWCCSSPGIQTRWK
eukprot:1158881-Pelagomonas_calceolata.AAC.1